MFRSAKALACVALIVGSASCADHDADRRGDVRILQQSTTSMEPLLKPGQRVEITMVTKYKPHRGDVVAFRVPKGWGPAGSKQIKRVIGIPGDRVACCDSRGQVTVDGKALNEPYVLRDAGPPIGPPYSVSVPAGSLWVLGDNRNNSPDSSLHVKDPGGGFVPVSNVVGVYNAN